MSKCVYKVKFYKDNMYTYSKLKFTIDSSKKRIREVREEIKIKLVHRGDLSAGDEIVLMDGEDCELFSDEDIDAMLPKEEKSIKVMVKTIKMQVGSDKSTVP